MESLSLLICSFSWDPSLEVMEQEITGRDTPQARPRACLEWTKTYGTFLSSARRGRWRRISMGSVSAAMMTTSAMPRLRVCGKRQMGLVRVGISRSGALLGPRRRVPGERARGGEARNAWRSRPPVGL